MQSKRHSMLEACLNTASGMVISLIASWIIYPLYGFHPTAMQNLSIVVIFTVISVARSYMWRRAFNWYHHRRTT